METNPSFCPQTGTGISYQRNFASRIEQCATRARYLEICDSPELKSKRAQIVQMAEKAAITTDPIQRKNLEERAAALKRQMPLFMYMDTFPGGERKKEQARLNGLVFADYDHVSDPRQHLAEVFGRYGGMEKCCQDFGILHIKISARGHGFHVVAKADIDFGGIADNQQFLDLLFELPHDEQCKDPSRGCFATPSDTFVYLSDELFTYQNPQFEERFGAASRGKNDSPESLTASHLSRESRVTSVVSGESPESLECTPAKSPVLGGSVAEFPSAQPPVLGDIIAEPSPSAPSLSALLPAVESRALRSTTLGNAPGNHNNTLYRVALYMRAYQDSEQWLLQNLPRYNQSDSEFRATVHSACQAELPRGAKSLMKQALQEARQTEHRSAQAKSDDLCPPLPAVLPPFIYLLSLNVPDHIKPAAIIGAMPAVGAHCGKVRLQYIDNRPHYTALMSLLIAGSAGGKSGMNDVVDWVMADIVAEDRQSRLVLDQWKQRNQGKQTKDKEPKPRVPIRYLPANTTNAAFWEAIQNVNPEGNEQGDFLFARTDELEALTQISGGKIGRTICPELSQLIQFNYDSAQSGQQRVSLDAVNVFAPMKFNFTTACTPDRAVRFFGTGSVTDGCLSRMLLSTIIQPADDEMPVYGEYTPQWQEQLRTYINRLNAAQGEIRSTEVDDAIRLIMSEQKQQAELAASDMMRVLLRREVKTAHRIAMLLYIAQDRRWDSYSTDFIRWLVRYGIWCKMRFFGIRGEQEIQREQSAINPASTSSLLDQLPPTFTRQQAINVRLAAGKTSDPKGMLNNWKRRGYIEQTDANTCRKTA